MSFTDDPQFDAFDQLEVEAGEFRWTDGLPWAVFLGIAWLVFELTAEPALSAGIFCLKFGWKDCVVGLWLRRSDPRRARGLSCLLFYLASAGWKAMMAGISVTIVLLFVRAAAAGQQGAGHELTVTLSVAGIGFAVCCVIGVLGIGIAWRGRVRVWLDSSVYWSYRDDVWPPATFGGNRIGRVLIVTQLVGLVFGTIGLVLLLMPMMNVIGGEVAAAIMLTGMVTIAVLVLWLPERINARIAAKSPLECWPDALTDHSDP